MFGTVCLARRRLASSKAGQGPQLVLEVDSMSLKDMESNLDYRKPQSSPAVLMCMNESDILMVFPYHK